MSGRLKDGDDPISRFVTAYLENGRIFEENETRRIASVLRENLDTAAIPSDGRICCLGVGEGIETLALRSLFPDAQILGVDKETPTSHGYDYIRRAGAQFESIDAGEYFDIIAILNGKSPDLVICRHPNIHIVVEGTKLGLSRLANEWALILGGWAKIASTQNKQLLVTTYFREDRDFLADFMIETGISPISRESAFGNPVKEFAAFGMKTDGYILKV